MKAVPIPGSKFKLHLEDEENQWWLRLRINSAVEEELPLTHLEKKTLKSNITEILHAAHVNVNELQIDMIQKDIWEFIQEKLNKDKPKSRSFGTIEDPRYEEAVDRLDKLAIAIKQLEYEISDKEHKLT